MGRVFLINPASGPTRRPTILTPFLRSVGQDVPVIVMSSHFWSKAELYIEFVVASLMLVLLRFRGFLSRRQFTCLKLENVFPLQWGVVLPVLRLAAF